SDGLHRSPLGTALQRISPRLSVASPGAANPDTTPSATPDGKPLWSASEVQVAEVARLPVCWVGSLATSATPTPLHEPRKRSKQKERAPWVCEDPGFFVCRTTWYSPRGMIVRTGDGKGPHDRSRCHRSGLAPLSGRRPRSGGGDVSPAGAESSRQCR